MRRVRIISKEHRFGPFSTQREITGDCDVEYDDLEEALNNVVLRRGDVLAIPHALVLGKFHVREKHIAYLAGREVLLSMAGEEPIPVDTVEGRARVHEQAKEPTGRGTAKQARAQGRPRVYPDAKDISPDQMAMLQQWWAGVMNIKAVGESAGMLLKCPPVPKAVLYNWLGKRPPNPLRKRAPRSDKGQKKKSE